MFLCDDYHDEKLFKSQWKNQLGFFCKGSHFDADTQKKPFHCIALFLYIRENAF